MAISESAAQRYQLQDPDVRLMLEVRDDNAEAFDELMMRYQSRLVTVLEHLTGRRDQAEDLAQETLLRGFLIPRPCRLVILRYVAFCIHKTQTWSFVMLSSKS